jgi:putative DNA primase/helicase
MTIAPPKALAELQRWPHWVIWRDEERDGKPTKVPYQARYPERRASSTDPATWATHMAAKSALAQGKGDGLGYVFAEDDEYAGVDLDHCVVDGKVAFGARAIVDRLASYTELSPSGTGLHIIVRAGLNGGRNRTKTTSWGGDFETYDRGRFFTITGEHLAGTPTTIESRQEELDAIRAELFPAPATANVALTYGKPPARWRWTTTR